MARRLLIAAISAGLWLTSATTASGAVTSTFSDGQLQIRSDGADGIAVTCSGGSVQVNGSDPDTGPAACSAVTQLMVVGGDGGNAIDLSGVDPTDFSDLARFGFAFVQGRGGNDTITGAPIRESLFGDDGEDVLRGGGGSDFLTGGAGADTLDGQDGSDQVLAEPGDGDSATDTGTGADDGDVFLFHVFSPTPTDISVTVDAGGSVTSGGATAVRGAGFEFTEIDGGAGNDTLDASAATVPVVIDALEGDDRLAGGSAADFLFPGPGANTLDGGAGGDFYTLLAFRETFAGPVPFLGTDTISDTGPPASRTEPSLWDEITLSGGAGADTVSIGANALTVGGTTSSSFSGIERVLVDGGGGDDVVDGSQASVFVNAIGGDGRDTLTGGGLDDFFEGGPGDDTLIGGSGSDQYFLVGGGSDRVVDAGGEFDALEWIGGEAITVDLSKQNGEPQVTNGANTLAIDGQIEVVRGSSGDDSITGNSAANFIDGGPGRDTIAAGDGDDTVEIGDGGDVVDGQAGSDSYFVRFGRSATAGPNGSRISDSGASGTDALDYDCDANASDSGTQLATATATVTYAGIEVRRCGTFGTNLYVTTFTPAPAAPGDSSAASGDTGGAATGGAPAPGETGGAAPSAATASQQATPGTAGSIALGSGPTAVTLSWQAQTFAAPVTVTLAEAASVVSGGTIRIGVAAVSLAVTAADGSAVTRFAAPVELTFRDVPLGVVPAYSADGKSWTKMPQLASETLPAGFVDGWYRDGAGAVHVLLLHATYIGLLHASAPAASEFAVSVGYTRTIDVRRRRVVRVAVRSTLPGRVTCVLRRGSTVIAARSATVASGGSARLSLLVPRRARAGAYRLTVVVTAGKERFARVVTVQVRSGGRR